MTGPTVSLGGTDQEKVAQVVTAGISGAVTQIRLPIICTPGTAIDLEIQGVNAIGAPDGSVLSSSHFVPGPLPSGAIMQTISLITPVSVSVGTQLSLVVSGPSTEFCSITIGPPGDIYMRGNTFYDARPNAPGWIENNADLVFQTLVGQ